MPKSNALEFEPVGLKDYSRIYPYTSAFGEGSCQHSPVSMYSLEEKYGDAISEKDGFLYTLRSRLCDQDYRVYLAPLGGGSMKEAFERLFADAESYGKRVKIISVTERAAEILEQEFPGRFDLQEERDLAEYMFRSEIMGTFVGHALQKRRTEVHAFWHLYGERAAVSRITPEDFPGILEFEQKWLAQNKETHDMNVLEREARMIEKQLAHFDALHLSGVVLRIDGEIVGFGYGTKLSDHFYDAIVEKGDRNIQHVYKVLRQESVKQCAMDCVYVNMEEDMGLPGLRALKYAYKPEYLLKKYIATERIGL